MGTLPSVLSMVPGVGLSSMEQEAIRFECRGKKAGSRGVDGYECLVRLGWILWGGNLGLEKELG